MCEHPQGLLWIAACSSDFWKVAAPIFVNLVLTAINFWLTGGSHLKKRNNERRYQSAVYLYQSLVVNKIGDFLASATKAIDIFNDTQNVTSGLSTNLIRNSVVSGCEKLHAHNAHVESCILRPMFCVSQETFSKLNDVWEEFYDTITVCTTELDAPLTPQLSQQLSSKMRNAHQKFLNDLGTQIRTLYPDVR